MMVGGRLTRLLTSPKSPPLMPQPSFHRSAPLPLYAAPRFDVIFGRRLLSPSFPSFMRSISACWRKCFVSSISYLLTSSASFVSLSGCHGLSFCPGTLPSRIVVYSLSRRGSIFGLGELTTFLARALIPLASVDVETRFLNSFLSKGKAFPLHAPPPLDLPRKWCLYQHSEALPPSLSHTESPPSFPSPVRLPRIPFFFWKLFWG